MKRRAPRPLSLALAAVTATLEPATVLASVQAVWAATVGEAIAVHCSAIGERGGVLEVVCDESVWAAELELMGPEVAERLRAALDAGGGPAIRALRCRTASH